MSFIRRPVSGRLRQTSRREDSHIVRNTRVHLSASSVAIQVQVAPLLGVPVSSPTIRRRLAEGHLRAHEKMPQCPIVSNRAFALEAIQQGSIKCKTTYSERDRFSECSSSLPKYRNTIELAFTINIGDKPELDTEFI
ncbi:HTH_Tnp_Tc3_2 domain-containing protein [Trichonephila clavipes]|nr:HTH_Tnp_Tc3_2 domain-containing protein [Trichonephila clavipes]